MSKALIDCGTYERISLVAGTGPIWGQCPHCGTVCLELFVRNSDMSSNNGRSARCFMSCTNELQSVATHQVIYLPYLIPLSDQLLKDAVHVTHHLEACHGQHQAQIDIDLTADELSTRNNVSASAAISVGSIGKPYRTSLS